MPKTYTTLTSVATGDVLTATNFNNLQTTVNNHTVPPICTARRAAAQAFSNSATIYAVNLDTEDIDTDGMFAPTANFITIQTTGIYQLSMSVCFSANSTGVRGAFIYLNPTFTGSGDSATINTGTRLTGSLTSASSALQTSIGGSLVWSLTAGNTIALAAYQSSGGSVSTNASASFEYTYLSAAWLGKTS